MAAPSSALSKQVRREGEERVVDNAAADSAVGCVTGVDSVASVGGRLMGVSPAIRPCGEAACGGGMLPFGPQREAVGEYLGIGPICVDPLGPGVSSRH
ncbi:hypothetical protein GN244_ATG18861 [Phytophthora infestans]|uniref:Uncharacterized protein n=1 Tax=Phytophthora infestans TaxID=4787 RepID=A0A833WJM1_PHYIN|nr:hypothetical protein GN244_ATG18861 [Phytophthora infestans]